jgi:1-acyl-sn-glycerol-3-phosphate acyltransferase
MSISSAIEQYPYPRRRVVRATFQRLARAAFTLLADFHVLGHEHLPQQGPLLVVANHFSPFDTAAVVAALPWPVEFLGGRHLIDAPGFLKWIPHLWGYYAVRRGSVSRTAMHAANAVLAQDGILTIFPEGGSWATVLRPARPGTAYLAVETGAALLPLGLDGLPEIFPTLRRGRRATVTVRIGQPFGPFTASGRGRARRPQLAAISEEIMRRIAALIPPERHGVFSDDPARRAAAQKAAIYPYADLNR